MQAKTGSAYLAYRSFLLNHHMKPITAKEIEESLGLAAGSVTVEIEDGVTTFRVASGAPERLLMSAELWQARTICAKRNKDAAVIAGIATLTAAQQQLANARWTYGGSPLQRDEWFVKQLRVWLGYTNNQMDNFFTVCAEL